jgi:hypothetical protein
MRVIFELDNGTRLIHEVGGVSPSPQGPPATGMSGTDAMDGGAAPTAQAGPASSATTSGPAASDAMNGGPAPTFLDSAQSEGKTAPAAAPADTAGAVNAGAAPSSVGY